MPLALPWRCEHCGAADTLVLDDDDLDDAGITRATVAAAHDAHPRAQRATCVAGPETVLRITLLH
jgi:hypothetical protein